MIKKETTSEKKFKLKTFTITFLALPALGRSNLADIYATGL